MSLSSKPSRKEMVARKQALKKQNAEALAKAKARVESQSQHPVIVKRREDKKRRRRQITLLLTAILLLLLLLMRCDCTEAMPRPPVPQIADVWGKGKTVTPVKVKTRKRPRGKVKKQVRDAMVPKRLPPPKWLPQFRMQVSSRDVSSCFNESEKPGALRWSVMVQASEGRVFDSELEPVFRKSELSSGQRECVIKILSKERYRLDDEKEAVPRRISIVFEF